MPIFIPEIQENEKVKTAYYSALCKSCYLCLAQCPRQAIGISQNLVGIYKRPGIQIDLKKCIACLQCAKICPEAALAINKKTKNAH